MAIRFHSDALAGFSSADKHTQADATGALELLSGGFEITWFSGTGPGTWLAAAKPDDSTRNKFGLKHECLVIGNGPFIEFQQRTLSQEMPGGTKCHFDPGIRFVVSGDPLAEAACSAWSAARKIGIVLFRNGPSPGSTSDEAFAQLGQVLSQYVWRRDLFDETDPVRRPGEFFGRELAAREIVAKMLAGATVAVFGLRKVGKSSLLSHIKDALDVDYMSVTATALLVGSTTRVRGGRWWTAAQDILGIWQGELLRVATAAGSKIQAHPTQLQSLIAKKVVDTARLCNAFEKDVVTLVKTAQALRTETGRDSSRLVLVLDACEQIYPHLSDAGHWRSDFFSFWGTLQNVKRRLDNPGELLFLLAGLNPSGVEQGSLLDQPNPLFETHVLYLLPLDRNEAGSLLTGIGERMGLLFPEDAVDGIFELVGGHPFLLRRFGTILNRAESRRTEARVISRDLVVQTFRKNKRDFYNQMLWILDNLRLVAPDEDRLIRDLAMGGAQAYDQMWRENDLRETFAFNLERYGLLRWDGIVPDVALQLIRDSLQRPVASEFEEQKRQLKSLVDAIESALRARLCADISKDRNASEAVHSLINAIPSEARNRPLGRQELIDLGEASGPAAILEAMNWGDYEILLNKLYDEILWCGPAVAKQVRLASVKATFLDAHLVRHNNDRELRELIKTEGFAALFGRFCAVRDMLAASTSGA